MFFILDKFCILIKSSKFELNNLLNKLFTVLYTSEFKPDNFLNKSFAISFKCYSKRY